MLTMLEIKCLRAAGCSITALQLSLIPAAHHQDEEDVTTANAVQKLCLSASKRAMISEASGPHVPDRGCRSCLDAKLLNMSSCPHKETTVQDQPYRHMAGK